MTQGASVFDWLSQECIVIAAIVQGVAVLIEVYARAQATHHDQVLGARQTCISQVHLCTVAPAIGLESDSSSSRKRSPDQPSDALYIVCAPHHRKLGCRGES